VPDSTATSLFQHGAEHLPLVTVDTYNAELRDSRGFLGDRLSRRALAALIDKWRGRLRQVGEDPFGDIPTEELKKKKLDKVLSSGDPVSAGLVHSVVEEFAQELAHIIRRFLRLKTWHDTRSIVVGGGLRASRIGELAIGRAAVLLKAEGHDLELRPIRHHPDEAGLIGCVQLAPSWIFAGHDGILAVDIGGSNIRAGVIELKLKQASDLCDAHVADLDLWRYANDEPTRDRAMEYLADMLRRLMCRSKKAGRDLAPFIGIGCPGQIRSDGAIETGGQNLPGNWESDNFNLPQRILCFIPEIGGRKTTVITHNDAVVQGLSEVSFMKNVARWGVLTVGTGLGNARFSLNAVAGAEHDNTNSSTP
jgi:hypothetical protein